MSKIRLAMIEDNKDLCDIIISHIQRNYNDLFDIVGTAYDGSRGCELVFNEKPDVVLIDLVLPILGGLSVLNKIKKDSLTKHIICIAVSSVSSESVLSDTLEMGADYYIVKPFDIDKLIERIIYLHGYIAVNVFNTDSNDKDVFISRLSAEDFAIYALQKISIPMNLNGYSYLIKAITLSISDMGLLDAVTKELYATVGAEFKTTGPRVERCIRNAIERAWEAGSGKKYYEFIGYSPQNDNFEKPTNSAFIFSMVSLYHEYHKNTAMN